MTSKSFPNRKGLFIACEGIDGAGKSTHISYIAEKLEKDYGHEVIKTREPGGTPLAEKIRGLLLSNVEEDISADAEVLLFNAARRIHIDNLILPALQEGKIVITDRFSDSTFAYQCAHGADYNRVKQIHDWTLQGFKPNFTFFFFVTPEIGLSRINDRNGIIADTADRFDQEMENRELCEKKMAVFLRRLNDADHRYFFIDASKDIENVRRQIDEFLTEISFTSQLNV